jgi:hypothetical protein
MTQDESLDELVEAILEIVGRDPAGEARLRAVIDSLKKKRNPREGWSNFEVIEIPPLPKAG